MALKSLEYALRELKDRVHATTPLNEPVALLQEILEKVKEGQGADLGTKTITPTTTQTTYKATSDNLDGYSEVTVKGIVLEGIEVTPTTSEQTITPTSGKDGINQVVVSAVTNAIDANIISENIKKDVTILGVTGSYEGEQTPVEQTPGE